MISKMLKILTFLFYIGAVGANTLFFEHRSDNGEIICPDKQGSCPQESTCCQLQSGKYACCPLPQVSENGQCPDGSSCPDGSTCCQLASGSYGCCPLPSATCCSDHLHCCPNGYTCDVSAGTCNKGFESISWFDKIIPKSKPNVVCPGGEESCPDGQTCCQLASGDYGCCPMPSATCCSDHTHCCPNGYTCDVSAGTCNKGLDSISWFDKSNAQSIHKHDNVKCPDQKSSCPDSSTCCVLASGEYGCCPYKDAVCCADHLHCCQNGDKCDVEHSKCTSQSEESIPWFSRKNGISMPGRIMCDDQVTYCADGQTCCKIASGYGCCPYPKASCCRNQEQCCEWHCWLNHCVYANGSAAPSHEKKPAKLVVLCVDSEHFCPEGFVCNGDKGTCDKKVVKSVPWSLKMPATRLPNVCTDSKKICRPGTKCCQSDDGRDGCCPFENGICCSDGNHCCPEDTTCDLESQMCKSLTANIAISLYQTKKKKVPTATLR